MEIIRELEPEPRGVYCGAVGAFAPDGAADFNVAIRTITIAGDHGRLNVGGAVVADSTAHGEYEECLVKARYFTEAREPLYIFETLRYSPKDGFVRADLHLERMARSAAAVLGVRFDPATARLMMQAVGGKEDLRVRLSLDEPGHFAVAAEAMEETRGPWSFEVSGHRVPSGDALARHKTGWRALYDGERERARRAGCDEVVFLNELDELVEGSITNIFLKMGGRLVTPPLASGCLDGCLRRELIARGEVEEGTLSRDDLARADAIYLGNSLRGLIEANSGAAFCERRTR
jgi:para-aminobenzoate synthetase/4-amino-4-deoxychorismate lyase